jgi:riboflavin kinase/FMN adenylyltransferase
MVNKGIALEKSGLWGENMTNMQYLESEALMLNLGSSAALFRVNEVYKPGEEHAVGLTIGAFDGVHLGHRALIRWMAREARRAGLYAVVLTFDPLPAQLLSDLGSQSGGESQVLSSPAERVRLIASLGVDAVIVAPFDEDVMAIPARTFVTRLATHLSMQGLWVGPDFALGRDREGDVPFLREVGTRLGFEVHVFDEVIRWAGQPVRSSRIRRALGKGHLEEANGCLGRPYRLSGVVGPGDRRGRELGFPTANLKVPPAQLLPAEGVYICRAYLPEGIFDAVTNVGTRPTFAQHVKTIEAHLLGFDANVYGEPMQLAFLHRLRPEMKFDSPEDLAAQLHKDVEQTRAWLSGGI